MQILSWNHFLHLRFAQVPEPESLQEFFQLTFWKKNKRFQIRRPTKI